MTRPFWNARRVLLTGHTGFKGSWLALWLADLGADVWGLSLDPPSEPNMFNVASVAECLHDQRADVRSFESVSASFERARPSIVFHLAAQAVVRQGYESPLETYATNVLGTAHILEAVRRSPSVRAVVVVTSDKCYENSETPHAYSESGPLGGYDPYSSSKACAEIVTSAYRRSFLAASQVAVATVRAGNVIGGGDWARDRLVPDLMRAFNSGETAMIRNPSAVRPWQHAVEPLSGCLKLAEKLATEGQAYAEAWNFGPEPRDARTVGDVVRLAASEWGPQARWTGDQAAHPHEAKLLNLDASKARARLGWRPRWTLETAMSRTVGWYKGLAAGNDMHSLTRAQIRDFMEVDSD